jgi:hypothetical protein
LLGHGFNELVFVDRADLDENLADVPADLLLEIEGLIEVLIFHAEVIF